MYELTGWNGNALAGTDEEIKILYDKILLDESFFKEKDRTLEIDEDVIDLEFEKGVKKADAYDYAFASFCGVVCFAIDRAIRKSSKIDKNINLNDIASIVPLLKELVDWNAKVEEAAEQFISKVESEVKNSDDYVKMAKDFTDEFDVDGMLLAILCCVFSFEIGEDENGNIIFNKVEDKYADKTNVEKIAIAFITWLLKQAVYYKENGKYRKEAKKFGSILKKLEPIIASLADALKYMSLPALTDWFVGLVCDHKGVDTLSLLEGQSIAVDLNIVLVHTYVHVKNFIEQVKEHNVKSLEGLKIIDFNRLDNQKVLNRLNTMSTGVFFALDAAQATAKAAKVAEFGPGAVVTVFAASINIMNCVRFIVVMKDDGQQILEDIGEAVHKAKIEEVHHYNDVTKDELEHLITLDKAETRILYSIKLQMINEDIQSTKENSDQQLKEEWKKKWMEVSKEAYPDMNKLFELDSEKVYKSLITNAENKPDKIWLYNIVSELRSFHLYTPIFEDKEENKKYSKLKIEHKTYFKDIFCQKQKYIEKKEIDEFYKCYKNQYNYLDNSTLKVGVAAAGAVAIGGITGGLAFAFAPEIAVAIFGGAFPALHGAALTSAALAAAGGGALAAGGLGMSGGAIIIAGGGALIGLGTSSALSGLLYAPKFVQDDNAKLLAKCEYVLLGKMHMIDEVVAFQKKTEEELVQQRIRLGVLQNVVNPSEDTKKKIKNLKKTLEYTKRTNQAFMKMIESYEKQHG
jgi:hypothetical protein